MCRSLNLKSIEYFIAVAEYGSLTQAAHHLYITQPALSKQIKLFEIEIGHKLFVRSPNGMILTEKGKNLLVDIQPLLYALKRKMSEHIKTNMIRFGVSPFLATYYLPELEGPNIKIELTVTREECFEFIQMLELGEIDSAIVQDCPDHPNLFSRFLYEEEFQLVAPKGHPLTVKETVELRECLKYPQVLPPNESRLYNNILSKLKEEGSLNNKIISVPYQAIIDYVMKGYGITYLPSLLVQHYSYRNLEFVNIKNKELMRKLYLYANSRHNLELVYNHLEKPSS